MTGKHLHKKDERNPDNLATPAINPPTENQHRFPRNVIVLREFPEPIFLTKRKFLSRSQAALFCREAGNYMLANPSFYLSEAEMDRYYEHFEGFLYQGAFHSATFAFPKAFHFLQKVRHPDPSKAGLPPIHDLYIGHQEDHKSGNENPPTSKPIPRFGKSSWVIGINMTVYYESLKREQSEDDGLQALCARLPFH